eukprot:9492749-Pyramimonas_sp.AAC.3
MCACVLGPRRCNNFQRGVTRDVTRASFSYVQDNSEIGSRCAESRRVSFSFNGGRARWPRAYGAR